MPTHIPTDLIGLGKRGGRPNKKRNKKRTDYRKGGR